MGCQLLRLWWDLKENSRVSIAGGESIMDWNLDLPKVVASLHANLSEVIPKMEFTTISKQEAITKTPTNYCITTQ